MAHAYKAFISYSHAADGKLAPALQHGLQQFARPWNQLRAIRVFRDKTGLTTTPGLWKSIVTALDSSEYFLLLASPQAAQSHWVDQEVRHWLSQPRTDRLLLILTEGDLAWNTHTLDVQRTNVLPPALQEFPEEPLWLDLRWARGSEQVSLQNPAFREAIADLSSTLRGIPKDQLIGEDVRQYRRATLFRRSAIASLTLLVFGLMAVAYVAFQQRNLAREQARIALARQLAAQSELIRTGQPERFPLALLMAAEATRSDSESMEAQQSLQSVLAQFPEPLATLNVGSGPVRAAVDFEMKLLVTSSAEETILWRLPDRQRIVTLPPFDRTVVLSADGKTLAGCCHSVEVWTSIGVRKFSLEPQSLAGQPTNVALSHDGRLLAIGFEGRLGPGFEVWDLDAKQAVFRREIELSGNAPALDFAPNGDLAVALRDAVEILPAGASAVTTLVSTGEGLNAIAYSADGRYLAWSSHNGTVVYDVREHKESARLTAGSEGPGAQVLRLAFSSDGQYLGAVGDLNTGAIWRGPNWHEIVAPRHAELQNINALAFHPSAPEAVTCASDGYCLSWSLSTGQKIRRFAHIHAHEGGDNAKRQIVGAEFGTVGSTLVTSGADGTVRLWNVTSAGETGRRECLGEPVIETFAPKGRQWSWPFMEEPVVTSEGCQIVPPLSIKPYTFVTDPTGTYGAAPQAVDVVRVWDSAHRLLTEIAHVDPVDWEAVQQRLINRGTRSDRAYLPIIDRMKLEGSVRVLALSPSGKYLITAREADEKLRIWDTASKQVVFNELMPEQHNSLFDFLSETRLLRVERKSEGKGSLTIIDLPRVATEWSTPVEWPAAVTISADRQVLAWADGHDKQFTIRVRETSAGSPLFEHKVAAEVKKLYFDRTHRFLVASVGEQPVVPSGLPFGCGFVLWQLSDGKEIAMVSETDHVIAFEFSADGSSFAAVNRDGRLRVWDLDSGAVMSTVLRNPGPLAFSASTKWIAVGSGSVQILDRTSLRPIAQLDFPADTRHIEFQSEDRVLAATGFQTGDSRGVTYLRYWQPADLLAEACKRIPLAAAEAQWRQLFVDRPLPAVCVEK